MSFPKRTIEFLKKTGLFQNGSFSKALAFDILFALLPLLIFATSIANLFGVPELVLHAVRDLMLPEKLSAQINDYLIYLASFDSRWLAYIGLALSIISFSRAAMLVMEYADRRCEMRRSLWKRLFLAVAFSVLLLVTVVVLLVAIVLGNQLLALFGLSAEQMPAISVARYAVAGALLLLLLAIMYRFAPTNPVRFRYTLPSALCCLAGVLIFSGLFSFYIDNFYRVSVLYGSLAAFIFLMMWIHLLARMLLLGFVFDHSAEMDTES